jgi:hypothetical protein
MLAQSAAATWSWLLQASTCHTWIHPLTASVLPAATAAGLGGAGGVCHSKGRPAGDVAADLRRQKRATGGGEQTAANTIDPWLHALPVTATSAGQLVQFLCSTQTAKQQLKPGTVHWLTGCVMQGCASCACKQTYPCMLMLLQIQCLRCACCAAAAGQGRDEGGAAAAAAGR